MDRSRMLTLVAVAMATLVAVAGCPPGMAPPTPVPPTSPAVAPAPPTVSQPLPAKAPSTTPAPASSSPAGLPTSVAAKTKGSGPGPNAKTGISHAARGGSLGSLTVDQKAQLQAKVRELRARNATPDETRAAMGEMLKGWGIELPTGDSAGRAPAPRGRDVGPKLTPDQKAQLGAKMKELHEKGASRDDILAAYREMLRGWGISPDEGRSQGGARAAK
jgi:hypothetical protein